MSKILLCVPLANLDKTVFQNLPAQVGGLRVDKASNLNNLKYILDDQDPRIIVLENLESPNLLQHIFQITKHLPNVSTVGLWMGEKTPQKKKYFFTNDIKQHSQDLDINPIDKQQFISAVQNNMSQNIESSNKTALNYKRWKTSEIIDSLKDIDLFKIIIHTPLDKSLIDVDDIQNVSSKLMVLHGGNIITKKYDTENMLKMALELVQTGGKKQIKSKVKNYEYDPDSDSDQAHHKKVHNENIIKSPDKPHRHLKMLRRLQAKNGTLDKEFENPEDLQKLIDTIPEDLSEQDIQKINNNELTKKIYLSIYESYFNIAGLKK
jgi:hypothetical protein